MAVTVLWVLGVLLAIAASVVSNLGLNLQKRAHLNMERLAKEHTHTHGTRRGRSGSTAGAPGTLASSTREGTPEKPAHPLSPAGILKTNKKADEQGYYLMDGGDEEAQRSKVQLPVSPDSQRQNSASGNAGRGSRRNREQENDSYTSQYELASGGINLDAFTTTRRGSASNTGVTFAPDAANGSSSSRTRSMSAATRSGHHRERPGHSSRAGTGHRRRSSLAVDVSGTGSSSATGTPNPASAAAPKKPTGHYTRQPAWVAGIVCVILGSLLDFAALAFVDQAVVAPLGSLTLVSNVIFAPLLLKEKVNRKQLYCTALIITGSILAVAFAPHSETSTDIKAMFANFAKARFLVYGAVSSLFLAGLRYASWRLNKIRKTNLHAYHAVARYHTFCYAACAGIMGAQSVLFAKCTAMLLAATFSGKDLMFVYWGTYFVLAGLGLTIFLQIRWLNSGLQRFSALMIVPIFQSFWILVSVVAGMIFFGEYAGVFNHVANAVMFPFGLALTICGVYFLTRISAPPPSQPPASADDSIEGAVPAGVNTARRRSRSHRGSISGTSSLTTSLIPGGGSRRGSGLVVAGGPGALGATQQGDANGSSSSPLLASATGPRGGGVGDHYGVPQSPRTTTTSVMPSASQQSKDSNKSPNSTTLDRIVDVGSYSDESVGAPPGGNADDDVDEEDVGSQSGSGSGSECDSDVSGDEDESATTSYHTLMMHSLAPINFLMTSLIPSRLMEESASPTNLGGLGSRSYFEENSSGFDGIQGGGGEVASSGGLPYANIFRVREESGAAGSGAGGDDDNDEENPPSPSAVRHDEAGINLFSKSSNNATSSRVSSATGGQQQQQQRGARMDRLPLNGGGGGTAFSGHLPPTHSGPTTTTTTINVAPISAANSSSAAAAAHINGAVSGGSSSAMDVPSGGLPHSSSNVGMFDPSPASSLMSFASGSAQPLTRAALAPSESFSITPNSVEHTDNAQEDLAEASAGGASDEPAAEEEAPSTSTAGGKKAAKSKGKGGKKKKMPPVGGANSAHTDSITDSLL